MYKDCRPPLTYLTGLFSSLRCEDSTSIINNKPKHLYLNESSAFLLKQNQNLNKLLVRYVLVHIPKISCPES